MQLLQADILLSVLVLHSLILRSDAIATPTALADKRRGRDIHAENLERRQSSPTTASPSLESTSLIPSIPTATVTSLSINLAHGVEDTWFPSNALTDNANPFPINIGCKNCSTSGTFNLAQGEWSVVDLDDLLHVDSFTDLISAGYVELSLQDFVAHVEIQIQPSLQGDISLPLFAIPIAGFEVRKPVHVWGCSADKDPS